MVEMQPINTTVAFSTSPLNLQGEQNKLEKKKMLQTVRHIVHSVLGIPFQM